MSSYYSARSRNPFELEDDGEDDLRVIKEKIGRVENDSLDSTRRALQVLNETNEIGVRTAGELLVQGEKLKNVDQHLDEINSTLNNTQKDINKIKSVFGGFKNKFFKEKTSKPATEISKKEEKVMASKTIDNLKSFNQPRAEFVEITGSDREKELNNNLDEMSKGLKNLANIGLQMQFELNKQNKVIDNITSKVDNTDIRIKGQKQQMNNILK